MNRWLHQALIQRPALLLRGESAAWRMIGEKRALERLAPDRLEQHIRARLAEQLTHAATRVAFYRHTWKLQGAVSPDRALEVLADLPFVAKRELQEHGSELRASGVGGRIWEKRTGGSTAEPVTVWKDANGMAEERAATWAALSWSGIRPSDRVARFWSSPLTSAGRRTFHLADLAMNRIRLSAFDLDDDSLERHWRRCRRFRPAWLY